MLAGGVYSATGPQKVKKVVPKTDYNRDIRPILSKCFSCHGQDGKAVQAELRINTRAGVTKVLPSGNAAVVPGNPEKSELVRRVFAKDANDIMPPLDSNKILTQEEKDLLRQWVAEGAEYKEHWAFVKPVRPALPAVKNKIWPKNAIDYFTLAKMEENGLKPSPEADKRTLIRRVTLDLIGVPPTIQDVNTFLADKSPKAYAKVVDRLLASPRYGERMAQDWMDYSRYADSNGYQADWERFQWRWRDYVIDAFNNDMPYDQFTVEQLAGDLLPHPTQDQIVATGFNRNHRINTEGGVVAEEWRVEAIIDRVETTSAVWLGLTTGCARCHDHKYDPISQKEFYSLFAYFNNVPESGTGEERPVNHPPLAKAPTKEQATKERELNTKLAYLDSTRKGRLVADAGKSDNWQVNELKGNVNITNGRIARYRLGDSTFESTGNVPAAKPVGDVTYDLGRSTGAVVTSDKASVNLGQVANFGEKDKFSYSVWINPATSDGSPIARMDSAQDYRGWDLFLAGGHPTLHLINKWPENAIKVMSRDVAPMNQWTQVTVTYDGTSKASGVTIYVNGRKTETDVNNDNLNGDTHSKVDAFVGRRANDSVYKGKVDDLAFYSRILTQKEAEQLASVSPAETMLRIPLEKRTKDQKDLLDHYWAREHDAKYKELDDDYFESKIASDKLEGQITTVMVMQEMPKPRDCFVLIRGEYDKHGDKVTMGLPAALPKMPAGVPNNRLGLAKWIVSPDNPLTGRVTMNRQWERLFGTGIVATSEDFGTRADFPSHPELLDWLATEFLKQKWDMKAMLKEMVMSATYRQTSDITPALVQADPTNKYLAHGPRFRLQAETIRDQALAVGGLLVEKLGGPSVRPYQPDGVWDDVNVYGNLRNYKHDTDSGLHRRSLYTIWKRTAAPPNMTLFDVPSRETCRIKRARTNTPLQALALLNDVTYLESARALAQRMLKEGGATPEARLKFAYQTVLSRNPSADELKILGASVKKRIAHYKSHQKDAMDLIKDGDYPVDKNDNPAILAAYTVIASTILNLDETLTKE